MSFRVPVSTQEPISTVPVGGLTYPVYRTFRDSGVIGVGGNYEFQHDVLPGEVWRLVNIHGAVSYLGGDNTQYLSFFAGIGDPVVQCNLMNVVQCPYIAGERGYFFDVVPNCAKIGEAIDIGGGFGPLRHVVIPGTDALLSSGYRVEWVFHNAAATDTYDVYTTVQVMKVA